MDNDAAISRPVLYPVFVIKDGGEDARRVVPFPWLEATEMDPLAACTMALTMASPNPGHGFWS